MDIPDNPPELHDRDDEYPAGYLDTAMVLVRYYILRWQTEQELKNDCTNS